MELDDETIGKALSSPLFIQEREEPADRRQAYHSHEESLLPAQSFFPHTSTGDPHTNLVRVKNESQAAKWKTKESGFSLKDKKEQILAEVRTKIQKHELQADADRRSIQELNGIFEFSEERLIILLQVMNNSDEINYFLMNNYQNKIGIFVKLISKVFMRWKN